MADAIHRFPQKDQEDGPGDQQTGDATGQNHPVGLRQLRKIIAYRAHHEKRGIVARGPVTPQQTGEPLLLILNKHRLVDDVGECVPILQCTQHPEGEDRVAERGHCHAPARQESLPGKPLCLVAPPAGHQDCHL